MVTHNYKIATHANIELSRSIIKMWLRQNYNITTKANIELNLSIIRENSESFTFEH